MKYLLVLFLLFTVSIGGAGEREVTLARSFGTLHGSLVTPENGSETAVLIIPGSGPTDRNCNSSLGPGTNAFLYLAQALDSAGIASLRYDKRGVGESRYDDPERMSDIRFEDFISDAAAWAEFLAGEGFRKIVLLGHSEGALIALAAAREHSAVSAVASVSGPGYPMDQLLEKQLAAQLALTDLPLLMEARRVLTALRQGGTTDHYPKQLEILFSPYLQRYLLSQMRYDPRRLIARLKIPVLVIGGDNDLQVSPDDAEALAAAQPKARKTIIRDMTHALKKCTGRTLADQIPVYTDRTLSLDPDFVKCVVDFIGTL